MVVESLASAGISFLLAAEAAPGLGMKNLEHVLPYAVGAVFALGVILVGVVMSRKGSAGDGAPATDLGEGQSPDVYAAPNPLWKLIVPGVAVLVLGSGIVFFVIPLFQEVSEARDNFQQTMKGNQDAAVQSVLRSSDLQIPTGQAVQIQPMQLPPTPQIQVNPSFVPPPPPYIPQPRVDSHGIIRIR